jgi:hypothetical protein
MDSFSTLRRLFGRRPRRALAATSVAGLVVVGAGAAVTLRATVAPTNGTPPTITGTARTGSTLTATPGSWNGSVPITIRYQWLICGAAGEICQEVAGATNQTYGLRNEDLGNTARVRVTATNADGANSATSGASALIAAGAPQNTAQPTISGRPATGSALTATAGTWTGAGPITFRYQWRICGTAGESCHDIGGATGQTYQLKNEDLGNTLRMQVTATNAAGSTSATSIPSALIAAGTPTPVPTGCPKAAVGAAAVSVANVTTPARLQVDKFHLTSGPITRGMTQFSMRVHVSDTCGQAVNGASVYATAVPYNQVTIPHPVTTAGDGWVTLVFDRLSGFPATSKQQLMVMFVRATKPGESLLAGVSTRRLISLPVNLRR